LDSFTELHWSHSHGSPRVFNPAAADLYNQLFQGEAGQRTVANEDAVVEYIPESANYTHVLQGFHIYGENATYGMSVSQNFFYRPVLSFADSLSLF